MDTLNRIQGDTKFRACIPTLNKMCFQGKGLTLGEIRRLNESYFREDVLWIEFTGLTDRIGKEIYEGDIVISMDTGNYPALVERDAPNGGFNLRGRDGDYMDIDSNTIMKVIGNIYEGLYKGMGDINGREKRQ